MLVILGAGGIMAEEDLHPALQGRPVRPLPDALVDQIAAGEVVERPASVVKELVENALDAGAGHLRIEVRAGGRDFVSVADDGSGMTPEDARLALQRHATSKLATSDDLQRISTYGFRGEALPAIASVSKLRLRTRTAGAAEGFEIRAEEGRILPGVATGGPQGSRVEVADLFANVPARRKFLKTVSTEWGHVADWLARAALALPEVHFEIRRDDRTPLAWPGCTDLLDRVAMVLGEPEAQALLPVQRAAGPLLLHGLVSRPDRHRPTLAGVYLFVNGRPVRDRMLQHALVEVYRDVLPRGRFPSAVLFLELPPDAVDVNVHPAKWEVRFSDPQSVHRLMRHAVRETHAERAWLPSSAPAAAPDANAPAPTRSGSAWAGQQAGNSGVSEGAGDWIFADATSHPRESSLPGLEAPSTRAGTDGRLRFADLRLLGQLLATYLVLEGKEGLLLLDQHAAHERVLYEGLRAEWRGGGVASQVLLTPITLSLAPAALRALGEAGPAVAALGFDVAAFGQDSVVLRAVPALLADRDPVLVLRDLADELTTAPVPEEALSTGTRALEAGDRLFASLACHSARRKGDHLDLREQEALLNALDAIPWAPTCPHGRPVAAPFELAEIERRFGRR